MKRIKKTKGFTIIEVVLVLAIAGLIFTMVFVALPALQRAQRDTETKNNVSVVSAGIVTYVSNNGGDFPLADTYNSGSTSTFNAYISEVYKSNTTNIYVETTAALPDVRKPIEGDLYVVKGSACDSATTSGYKLKPASSNRAYSITAYLQAGGGTYFCQSY